MSPRTLLNRSLVAVAAVTAVLTLALVSCSSESSDADSGGDSGTAADMSAAEPESAADNGAMSYKSEDARAGSGEAPEEASLTGQAQLGTAHIKTATVEMGSDDVTSTVDDVYLLAARNRGAVTAESTSTDNDGVAAHSRIEIRVPVAKFEPTLQAIKRMGTSVNADSQDIDVTAEVADVNSRVKSAEQSIAQLRQLFNRATKLGDIITLERELSQRQADLEALQAQQRSLAAQTTMSTITVSVHLDEGKTPATDDDDQAGFVAGIQQGWDGFVTFVIGLSHAVGLLLPLGTLALVLAWLSWLLVRRYRGFGSQPSPVAGAHGVDPSVD